MFKGSTTKEKVYLSIIIVLVISMVFVLMQYYTSCIDFQAAKASLKSYQYNAKVLTFTRLFVTKVLKAQGEVSFEDRLQLENAIREINNKALLDQWQRFIDSATEEQAQAEVKNLLEMLINKVGY
ncbi:MAG: hypothetical protein WC845_00195 [Candidatus Staskawiczbacteria bacterium]|jgi:hypothetical protein